MPYTRYHCIRQHDMKDCGAACLATVFRQYGLKYPISRIRETAGTDKQGTSLYGMVHAAEKLGFTAKAVQGDRKALFSGFPLPAVAHVVMDGGLHHYVVIHNITQEKIVVADPAQGVRTYKPEDFLSIWTGLMIVLVPNATFQQGNETKGLFARFFQLLLPQRKLILSIFVTSLLFTVLGIAGAFYFTFLLDDIIPQGLEKTLHLVSLGVIGLALFKIVLSTIRSQLLLRLSQNLDIALILGYYQHVLRLPVNFFATRKTGEIMSRLMDASNVRDAISGAALSMMIDTLMVVAGGAILYSQNAFLFGVTAIIVPLYAIIVWTFRKPFEEQNRKAMENNAQLNAYFVESINGIETVKAYQAERQVNEESEKKFVMLLRSIFKLGTTNNYQNALKSTVQAVGGVVILWVGAIQVLKGHLSVGQLITFNALLAYFLDPIQNLINLQSSMQTAVVAAERLGEIFDLEPEKEQDDDHSICPDRLDGAIELNSVNFRYGMRDLNLRNLSMTVQPGEKIALVGESGSGKTTLVKLLMSFYPFESGDIRIGGHSIQAIQLKALRNRIAYIPQDTFFFSGTIQENLTLGDGEDIGMEQIVEAAAIAQAHSFISELPMGYDTMLEENGSNLSGGQRQRLAIARAILKRPDILIMDEATSNLDSTTERAISETINSLQGITAIMIAHRLSTIMRCDRIYVMDKGGIIDQGTHDELMSRQGKYYELWKDQLHRNTSEFSEMEKVLI